MAFNSETLKFLAEKLEHSDMATFVSQNKQLFNYINSEVKDNSVIAFYEEVSTNWDDWGKDDTQFGYSLQLPDNLEDCKALAYSLFKRMADGTIAHPIDYAWNLFGGPKRSDGIGKLTDYLFHYFYLVLEDVMNANPEDAVTEHVRKVSGDTTFIIHGHDELLKAETQNFLYKAGVNNVILHEMTDGGRTIIDKLIEESDSSNYAIALISPDDLTVNGTSRARQNVIFEIGYFMGKLGKNRVRLIVRDEVEIPSDLQGILYSKYDQLGAWKVKLIKEMISVGIKADIDSVLAKF